MLCSRSMPQALVTGEGGEELEAAVGQDAEAPDSWLAYEAAGVSSWLWLRSGSSGGSFLLCSEDTDFNPSGDFVSMSFPVLNCFV